MRLSCQLYACARRAAAVRVYARLPYGKENCIKKILHKTIRGKKNRNFALENNKRLTT